MSRKKGKWKKERKIKKGMGKEERKPKLGLRGVAKGVGGGRGAGERGEGDKAPRGKGSKGSAKKGVLSGDDFPPPSDLHN